jgi:hypothetical protein
MKKLILLPLSLFIISCGGSSTKVVSIDTLVVAQDTIILNDSLSVCDTLTVKDSVK